MMDRPTGAQGVQPMRFEVLDEREDGRGWRFGVQAEPARTELASVKPWFFDVRLAWADYNHWSADGTDEPAAVAVAVLRTLLETMPAAELRTRFDCSLIRRLLPDADERVSANIGKS
jgi:hypothetical protein